MFFVTVLDVEPELWNKERIRGEELYTRIRCWGYLKEKETARKAILENWTDIYEDAYYNLAVIEELDAGIPATHGKETWFSVTPIINPEYVKREEEKQKAWEEADFFGKRFGQYLHRALLKRGFDVNDDVGNLHEISKYVPNLTGAHVFKIENAEESPIFTEEQTNCLLNFLELSDEELKDFFVLQKLAIEDNEHHGVPESLKCHDCSWGSGPKDAPSQRVGLWRTSGYDVVEIEKPLRFRHICGWSLA